METQYTGQEPDDGEPGAIERARAGVAGAIGHVPAVADDVRHRAEQLADQLADQLPTAFERVRSGAKSTVTRLQTMPDSGLRLLVAASIGLGAGLRLAGAPRLAMLAGFAPASVFGFAIVSRPNRVRLTPHVARP